ncbi:MAG: penicillin acylase family protein [Burkholderiales bacterium]|nr:penicillin acylase family protein [Burkholderiales bacterium]
MAASILALAVLAGVAAYLYLLRSLPQTRGDIRLAGLGGPVEVLRDRYGIPHIHAQSLTDAVFALGFVHAQDRLWQMEINRRIAAGRLSEVVGPAGLETDRFLRTLGIRRAAEANLNALDEETRSLLRAYADGVNAFLATDPVLPVEFWLTGVRPEPWTPADSIAWVKMMAWDLGGNWRSEVLRMRLAKTLPLSRIHQFLPPYPGESPPEIADLKALYGSLERGAVQIAEDLVRLVASAPGADGDSLGSNNWAVSGERSASGKPLLANDPHLGLTAPPVWYFAHLSAPGVNVIGATLPGVPAVVLGRNDRIAWGFTNTGPDVQDLYLEKLDAAGNYLAPDGPRPFRVVEETIRVKGAEPERLRVRISRHGPVISDVSRPAAEAAPRGYAVALAWTALAEDDRTMQAAIKIARARDWESFLEAARDFHTPQQNMVYADVEGNIGFVAAGRVPVRKPENDLKGMAPAPGWLAKYDWAGYIPFEELPRAFNPPSGAIVTANHRITPQGYARFITSEWQPPYRAERIRALLEASPKHTVESFARIQADVLSLAMRELLPRLLAARPRSEEARRALASLATWDGTMASDRPEPLIAWGWWRELARAIYADELADAFRANWRERARFLAKVLSGEAAEWCDDVRTAAVETCEEQLAVSLEAALSDLKKRYGEDMKAWRWGRAHEARHEHRPLGRQPLLARLFDIAVPSPGDAYTVNVGRSNFNDEARPFANRHAASLRAIYDLADPERSLFIHSGGQSGNVLSPHYAAFSEAWAKNEYIPMVTRRETLEAQPHEKLRLLPAK